MNHTIDAKGKALGRLASEIAVILRGKDQPSFQRHLDPKVSVKVMNAGEITLSGKKMDQKVYHHYTGYPGGMKADRARQIIEKQSKGELLRRAVRGMLPNNKLRSQILKRLTITD